MEEIVESAVVVFMVSMIVGWGISLFMPVELAIWAIGSAIGGLIVALFVA